jgi:hypothetical protein
LTFAGDDDADLPLDENLPPASGLDKPRLREPPTKDHVRRTLAYVLLGLFTFTVIAPWVSLWIGRPDVNTIKSVFPVISGQVVALLGAVSGFYFGEKSAERRNDKS